MAEDVVCDIKWSPLAVEIILKPLIVLGLLEVAEHVIIPPPDIAELAPAIIVLSMAANIDHVIDGAGPTQGAPPRPRKPPQIAMGLWYGPEPPVIFRVWQHGDHRRRMD